MIATDTEILARAVSNVNRLEYLRAAAKSNGYSDEFYTPARITEGLGKFDLDPCAGPTTKHAKRNIRPPEDGLAIEWKGRVWMNPPYSNVHVWLERFVEHANGIALVNARCETGWFQRLSGAAHAMLIPRGRIRFEPRGNHPPVGSALIAVGKRNVNALKRCKLAGLFMLIEQRA